MLPRSSAGGLDTEGTGYCIVWDTAENSVVMVQARMNNMVPGKSEILEKYEVLIWELRDRRRKDVVAGTLPEYDVEFVSLGQMLNICREIEVICRTKEVDYIELISLVVIGAYLLKKACI